MTIFEKDGYVILLKKDIGEPTEHLVERGYFVVSQKPKTQEEYDIAILYSRIYINKKYKKCKYGDTIENKLMDMSNRALKKQNNNV